MIDATACPECGQIAEVQWRAVMESTDGPIEHVKIICVQRHWFLLPVDALPARPAGAAGAPTAQPARSADRNRTG